MAKEILTTLIGSYPVPAWLASNPSEQALDDAVRSIFQIQELAGIDLVVDGELYRFDINHPETNGMIEYFVSRFSGCHCAITRTELNEFRARADMGFRTRPSAVVVGEVGEGTLNLPDACERFGSLSDRPFKFTLTGPHMLAKTLLDKHYGSRERLCAAIAEVLAGQVAEIDSAVVQVDEANITGNPDEAVWALECINRVLKNVKTTAAVHLCFGNYGGQSIQKGDWNKLIEFIGSLEADHVLLEVAHRGNWELDNLARIDHRIKFGLGVIDIKVNRVETAEEIARAIDSAAEVLGGDRIAYINPDCGFWMLPRSVSDRKIEALVKGRDLYEGRS